MAFIIIFILAFVIWCFLKISSVATELEEKMQNLLANKKAGLKVEDSEIIDIKQQLDKINM